MLERVNDPLSSISYHVTRPNVLSPTSRQQVSTASGPTQIQGNTTGITRLVKLAGAWQQRFRAMYSHSGSGCSGGVTLTRKLSPAFGVVSLLAIRNESGYIPLGVTAH